MDKNDYSLALVLVPLIAQMKGRMRTSNDSRVPLLTLGVMYSLRLHTVTVLLLDQFLNGSGLILHVNHLLSINVDLSVVIGLNLSYLIAPPIQLYVVSTELKM